MSMRPTLVEGKSSPCAPERLTADESARRFDILEGIDAIPVKAMPARLKPLARRLMSHSGYGQQTSYASHDTLAGETGCSNSYVRRLTLELVDLGFFIEVGRRHSESKHARPEFEVGSPLVAYLRGYFAIVDARKSKRRRPTQVATQCDNLSTGNGEAEVATQGGNQVATQCDNQVATQGGNNPEGLTGSTNRVNPPPQSFPQGGTGGRGGGSAGREARTRRGGKDNTPSTQSRWRDLSVIDSDQWTTEECDALCLANMVEGQGDCLVGLEGELTARWPDVMEAANGRYDLIMAVLDEMGETAEKGKKFPSPMGFVLTVLEQRARSKTVKIAAMPKAERPTQKPISPAAPEVPAPVLPVIPRDQALDEVRVREGIRAEIKRLLDQGRVWGAILADIDKAMVITAERSGLGPDDVKQRREWLDGEMEKAKAKCAADAAELREQMKQPQPLRRPGTNTQPAAPGSRP